MIDFGMCLIMDYGRLRQFISVILSFLILNYSLFICEAFPRSIVLVTKAGYFSIAFFDALHIKTKSIFVLLFKGGGVPTGRGGGFRVFDSINPSSFGFSLCKGRQKFVLLFFTTYEYLYRLLVSRRHMSEYLWNASRRAFMRQRIYGSRRQRVCVYHQRG